MRRAVLALGGTVAGLAALFSYKTHVPSVAALSHAGHADGVAERRADADPVDDSRRPPSRGDEEPATKPTAKKTDGTGVHPPADDQRAPPKPSGTFTGPPVDTQLRRRPGADHGQQREDHRTPTASRRAAATSARTPCPQLNQEVLTAQSANIQGVSGATYTSQGYIQSLQQAIDQAHL